METEPSKRIKSINTLTDGELIREIQSYEITDKNCNDLKAEFHLRVKNRLFQYCQRLCHRNRFDDSTAKDIFQQTLIKAFSKIKEFELESSELPEKSRNLIFAWLNKIASNLFIDFLTGRAKTVYFDNSFDELESEDPRPDEFEFEENDNTDIILQQAWDDLDERERLIFYFCIKYNCLGNKRHLPDDVINIICKNLNIEKGNLRVIKLRALTRLRSKFL